MSQSRRSFASDNVAPVAPEIMAALIQANTGTVHSYGDDPWTARLQALAREVFECELLIFPVATGTCANALALASLTPAFGAIYCHEQAHVNTDECGAPEFYAGGAKLIGLPSPTGKLQPEQLAAPVAHAREMGVHHVLPAALSLSQATEWGTVYSCAELAGLTHAAHELGLAVHMDGARFANAIAHLGCSPAAASWRSGIDVLTFGATKNGALAAEAVIFFRPELAHQFELRRKRAGQLWSKMRYLSAQLVACLEHELWLRHAHHANALATRLAAGLQQRGLSLLQEVQANEVFAAMPSAMITALHQQGFEFYQWPAPPGQALPAVRLVTAYDMGTADIDALLGAIGQWRPAAA
jgi:threonine aldolase